MSKIVVCTKCKKSFTVDGPNDGSRQIAQGVTCPHCKEPNEVDWPMNMGFEATPS